MPSAKDLQDAQDEILALANEVDKLWKKLNRDPNGVGRHVVMAHIAHARNALEKAGEELDQTIGTFLRRERLTS